jgi:hypothetical protein
MSSLAEDLKQKKSNLEEFRLTAGRVLNYLPDVITDDVEFGNYLICSSTTAGTIKHIRPFNKELFLRDSNIFDDLFQKFTKIIQKLKNKDIDFNTRDFELVDQVIYTIQQSIGIGLDLVVEPNSSRKHVGNRFEELLRSLLISIGISTKKVVLSIPYETEDGEEYYRCETDVIISPFESVKSNSQDINPNEIVISLKTTTKDRMPKIFIDKILMEKFLRHPVQIIGISQNDVQRKHDKGEIKISYTFVSNLFMVYTKFLTELTGYYYLDVPQKATETPFNKYIFPFSNLILRDVWQLLDS